MILDIVDRDTKAVEKFEFDPTKLTAFETCNGIWKMINSWKAFQVKVLYNLFGTVLFWSL